MTEHPTAQWTAQQLLGSFPFDCAPRYLLRDRDAIYGEAVQEQIKSLGIDEVITAPRSSWQNPFVERIIGSIRRDRLDHVIVFDEQHLRRILRGYFHYYHTCRTPLSLNKDPPHPRAVETVGLGNIVALRHIGGLQHLYTRVAATIIFTRIGKQGQRSSFQKRQVLRLLTCIDKSNFITI